MHTCFHKNLHVITAWFRRDAYKSKLAQSWTYVSIDSETNWTRFIVIQTLPIGTDGFIQFRLFKQLGTTAEKYYLFRQFRQSSDNGHQMRESPLWSNKIKIQSKMEGEDYRCFLTKEFHICIISFSSLVTSTKSSSICNMVELPMLSHLLNH